MKRYSIFQKTMAMILSLVLIIGLVPTYAVAAQTRSVAVDSRVSDPNTMNQWQDYFGENMISTEFAGGVWTDKSVLTSASDFRADISMNDPDNHFLIALSALAANQQIEGYTSAPIDVMLVLDVSGSMQGSKATAMVQATNETIDSLLKQNNNNRVGVVLYSGNSSTNQNAGANTATVILPLDRYTTTSTQTIEVDGVRETIPAYFTISNNTVSVASTVRNSSGQVSGSKAVSGGTYIQNGLYKAWGEFSKVTDVKVPAGQAQAGAQRTPILVLMSDGQPTLATAAYNNVGTSERTYGDGQEKNTNWRTVFLTQLTASWVKSKMETKYGTTPKFYTLGLGTGSSNYATAVLQPGTSYETLDGYWDNFFDSSKLDNNNNVEIIPNTNRPNQNSNAWSVYKDSAVKTQNYSDMYKLASDTDELIKAFQQVVENIELDAAGHVTLVEAAGEDYSGYITFTDELGMFMEVKDVKGLVLGDTLFTGHELAKSLQESSMGTQQNPTDYGNEFIATVRERLGIEDVSTAQNLVIAAYNDGQLAYDAQTEAYSNYIGWYSDNDGTYLGFWDKDTGITAEGAPAGATWINKSYGYLGAAGSSDMMHVVVMICTHIESGMQVVQYKIPASLIPMVTYEIELNSADPTDMKSITRKEAFPLRLVYEVGLSDEINSINMEQKLDEAIEAGWGHAHQESDGSYAFYTNLWGAEHGDSAVDYNDPLNHRVAQSHFHPAEGNDRYYYTEDTPVYVKSGSSYSLYNGSAAPAGSGYYRALHYYTGSGYTTEYLPMSEYALQQAAAKGQQADGYWYIPEGAIFQQIDRFRMQKESNPTGTLEYYDYPVVVDVGDKYDTYAFLGNNGKITLMPAQGIKLTKTVTETVEGAEDSFTFDITLSQAVANPVVTDTDGNALTGWSVSGNVITVTLKAGETVCVTGLPTGVTYTVTERAHADYIGSSENATGTVATNTIHDVDFVNIPRGYGNLIISKDVDHPFTTVPAALTDKEFTIQVTLSGDDVANQQFAIGGTDPVQYITTDANGSFTVTLKDNGSVTVVGLPEGTTFTTTEILDAQLHNGFAMDADRSTLSGTIVKDTAVQTHVVNVYEPAAPETAIQVAGTKNLVDEAGAFDWEGKSFTVRLEQYDPATGTYSTLGEKQVTAGSLSYLFADYIRLDELGDYYFKVSEVIPEERLEGMSYDATVGRFEVRVTDEDVDGQLELTVYDFDTKAAVEAVNGVVTYTKNFENIHTTDATYVEFTANKNVVDPHNTGASEAGFLFELFEVVNGNVSDTAAYSIRTVLVNGQGQATFHIPITKTGSRTFILKENVPSDANKIPGMIYDTAEYTVVVSATAQDGKLVPALTITKSGQEVALEDVIFENVIDLEPIVLQPKVSKTLMGRDALSDSEFTFQVVQTDGSFATAINGGYSDTVSMGQGEKSFKEITITQVGTYYFRATEVAGQAGGMTYDSSIYHITVNVTVVDGKLVKEVNIVKVGDGVASTQTDVVHFTNTYVNTDTEEVVLRGSKSLTGRSLITGEFSFQLKQGEAVLQTVTNRADGSFVFEPITYTAADVGDHVYTVVEVNDGKGGVSYDETVYTVTVTVADNGQGELVVTTTGADAIAFNNSYSAKPVSVGFSGTKTWYNTDLAQNKTLTGGEFTFVLYATDANYSYQGSEVARTTNNASGAFSMGLTYSTAGHYYYLLRELVADDATVGYDAAIYHIHIVVYDNGVGNMVGSVAEISQEGTDNTTIRFNNTYTPKATELAIEGVKELTGRYLADGEFSFQLLDASGTVIETVSNLDGKFTFGAISYDKTGTYTYQVKEVIPEQATNNVYHGVTYDTTVFDVTVTVTDNNGTLEATYTASVGGTQQELKFVNDYGITKYTDFDLSGEKGLWLDGKSPIGFQGRSFRFAILDDQGVTVQTVTADSDGKFSFDNVPLTETGLNTFTVVELNDGLGGIDYDQTVYTVTVDVADDGKGNLIAAIPQVTLNGESAELKFNNGYTLEPTQLHLQVEKILVGKTLKGGMFQFELRDDEGNVLQTVENNDTGNVIFDVITYDAYGTVTYTIHEVIPTGVHNGIGYDETVIHVTVNVLDNGDGTLSAEATYENLPVFTNTYTVVGDPQVDIFGTKNLTGRDLADDEFTFVLTDANGNTTEVTNKGSSFTFEDVKLPGLGKHTFTVSEKNTGKGGVSYDARVYDVSVIVSDDGMGGMIVGIPMVTYHGVATGLVFTNSYSTEPVTYEIQATKNYNKPLNGGEFSFTLIGEGVTQTKTNDANGLVTFDELTFDTEGTYTYTVTEVKGDKSYITYDETVYTVTIEVTDNGEGQLEIASVKVNGGDEISFTNTYTLAPTEYTLTAEKTYTKELLGGEFQFTLTGEGQEQTKTNAAGGAITFDTLTFETEGTYTYTVTEVKGDKSYITYDETVYTVAIEVADDNQGQLFVKNVTVSDDKESGNASVKFDNVYVLTGEPVFTVDGTKELTGRYLVDGEFTFVLTDAEGNTVETTNVGNTFAFTNVALPGLGEHVFTLTEKNTGVPTITYDETAYTVTVTVTDNNEGGMDVSDPVITVNGQAAELVFHNVYTEPDPVTVEFVINKTVTGADMSAKDFLFELLYQGESVVSKPTNEDGYVAFILECSVGDVGVHEFVLREINTGVQYVTYDTTEYAIEMTITENAQGKLEASLKLNGQDVEEISVSFTNHFDPPSTPQTGDSTNVTVLMGTMGFGVLGILVMLFVLVLDHKKRNFER